MISLLLISHERKTRYIRKESSRHDLAGYGSLFGRGDVIRTLGHARQAFSDRFVIRRAAPARFMVWDRESKGPAMFNGLPAVGLTEAQAAEIKIRPVKTSISGRR